MKAIVGEDELAMLLIQSFDGAQFANNYPLVKASTILYNYTTMQLIFCSISHFLVANVLLLYVRSELSADTVLKRD